MKVLVTGANGMLATHTIRYLSGEGYKVKALLRDKRKYQLEPHPAVELFQGDIRNKDNVLEAVKGCDFLVHTAAVTAPEYVTYSPYYDVNVTGTRNLLEAAVKNHLRKVIYVSSANTVGHGSKRDPGTESDKPRPPFTGSLYARSKLQAQELVESFSNEIEVAVVNPSFMIGSHDAKLGSGRIIIMGYDKKILFHPPGGKNFVNTKDVAQGIVAVLKKGRNRGVYLMTGENLTYREFFRRLNSVTGRNNHLIPVPDMVLLSAGYFSKIPQLLNLKTPYTLNNMEILCTENYYDNSSTQKELGIKFESIDHGITEAVSWFKDEGML